MKSLGELGESLPKGSKASFCSFIVQNIGLPQVYIVRNRANKTQRSYVLGHCGVRGAPSPSFPSSGPRSSSRGKTKGSFR